MNKAISSKEGNELIALFMDIKFNESIKQWEVDPDPRAYGTPTELLKYHTSWDWLMPVVEKINKDERCIEFEFYPGNQELCCQIWKWEMGEKECSFHFTSKSHIEAVWRAVVQFITWHNQQTTTSNL